MVRTAHPTEANEFCRVRHTHRINDVTVRMAHPTGLHDTFHQTVGCVPRTTTQVNKGGEKQ